METNDGDALSPMQVLERMFRVELSFMTSGAKDIRLLAEAFHPNVVIHEPSSLPYAGDWVGLTGVAGLMKKMDECFAKLTVEHLGCSGPLDRLSVNCTLHMTSRSTGILVSQPFAEVLRFEDGRLIEGTPFYFDTAEIMAAL